MCDACFAEAVALGKIGQQFELGVGGVAGSHSGFFSDT